MVDKKTLERSYQSRPRTAVVILGAIGLFLTLICLFLTLAFEYFPSFFAALKGYEITFAGETSNLFDFARSTLSPFIVMLVLLFPSLLLRNMANHRAAFFFLYIPVVLLFFAYGILLVIETFPMILSYIPVDTKPVFDSAYFYARLALVVLLLASCIFALCYNAMPCFKYREVYALRKKRVLEAEKAGDPVKKERIKKDFYRFYKAKDFSSLLFLLYRSNPDDLNAPMEEGEWRALAEETTAAEGKIRDGEFELLAKNREYALIRQIHARAVSSCENEEANERKAKEDRALFEFLKKNAKKTPENQAPAKPAPANPTPAKEEKKA